MKFVAVMLVRSISLSSLLFAGINSATASVTSSGDSVITQNYVIDVAQSTISYNPGGISFDPNGGSTNPSASTYNVSGIFTVNFDHYSWSNPSDWMHFTNSMIIANGLPSGFELPKFESQMISSTQFSGNDGACSGPGYANISCSGPQLAGSISNVSGQIEDGKILFNGYQPNALGAYGGGYTYTIVASAVPLPAAFWLFASALGFFGIRTKTK
jgi:hypothetical protein